MKQLKRYIKLCMGVAVYAFLLGACTGANNKSIDDMMSVSLEKKIELKEIPFQGVAISETGETVCGNQGNMINEGYICESDGYIYFSMGNEIYKNVADDDGTGKHLLVKEDEQCREICVAGDYVYYISKACIKRVNKNGGEAVVLTEEPAVYMQVTDEKIYFACNGIFCMNLDGSGLELITKIGIIDEATSDLIWVNVYGDYILYVAPAEDFTMYAVRKDGTEIYKIAENVNFPVVEGDYVYYQGGEERILKTSFTSGETREVTENHRIRPIIFEDRMYSTDLFSIYCYSTESNEEECVYSIETHNDNGIEMFIELYWVTDNRIFFKCAGSEEENKLYYIDYDKDKINVMR